MTLTDILKAAADGPDAVTALCTDMTDDALRAEIENRAERAAQLLRLIGRPTVPENTAFMGLRVEDNRQACAALAAELARRSLVDPGWECERCGHVNPDDAEYCAGEKCVAFREWAAQQPQEDQ